MLRHTLQISVAAGDTVMENIALPENVRNSGRRNNRISFAGETVLRQQRGADRVHAWEFRLKLPRADASLLSSEHLYQIIVPLSELARPVHDLVIDIVAETLRHGEIVAPQSEHLIGADTGFFHLRPDIVAHLLHGHSVKDKQNLLRINAFRDEPFDRLIGDRALVIMLDLEPCKELEPRSGSAQTLQLLRVDAKHVPQRSGASIKKAAVIIGMQDALVCQRRERRFHELFQLRDLVQNRQIQFWIHAFAASDILRQSRSVQSASCQALQGLSVNTACRNRPERRAAQVSLDPSELRLLVDAPVVCADWRPLRGEKSSANLAAADGRRLVFAS